MNRPVAPISFAGSQLRGVHALFNRDDEADHVLSPFIIGELGCRGKAAHLANPGERPHQMRRLAAVGIDTTTALQAGREPRVREFPARRAARITLSQSMG